MSDDLVKRLRDRGVCSLEHNSCRNDMVCEQAADRIEALEAQVAAADALAVIAQIIHDKCAHPTEGVTILDQKKLEVVLREYNEAKKGGAS